MPTLSDLISDFLAAGDTAVLAAGRALYTHCADTEHVPVSERTELEYFRTVQRFARFGGDRTVAHALLCWVETEFGEHEIE